METQFSLNDSSLTGAG